MQTRTNPKTWCVQDITNPHNKWEKIGQIMLVSYMRNEQMPHLEFFISDDYNHLRGQGIMSREVTRYLKHLKKWKWSKIIAVAKKDNIASQKILERNYFIKVSEIEDKYCYMTDLTFSKEKINKMIEIIYRDFPVKRNN
jgi:RimJ/RimL family protein N-acetyltransferase